MRNLRRPKRLEPVFELLFERAHSETQQKLFGTIRDAYCFAALVGFEFGSKLAFSDLKDGTNELDSRLVLGHAKTLETVRCIALAETQSMEVLKPERENELVSIFEEYVAGGLEEIQRWVRKCETDLNGDVAIIDALRARGYLDAPRSVEASAEAVKF
jgi:dnd system-associated protein 4